MDIPGYQISEKIGKGGMADVYLATQVSLSRPVVLKIMHLAGDPNDDVKIERFLAEGRIVASLNHPNIITIYDIGITDNNSLYISMEYINNGDLKGRIGIPMDPLEALGYLLQISSGLKTAHEHGIIHRDVKPANILFRDDDTPLLTDFGIAKQLGKDLDLTQTNAFLGSPNYISPEQAGGGDVDERSDIYSLGCVFYEMVTGDKPYHADSVIDVVMQHNKAPVPTLPENLQKYQPLLDKMMAKDRNDRFSSAADLMDTIRKLQGKVEPSLRLPDFIVSSYEDRGKPYKTRYIILLSLLFVSAVFFSAIEYVDYRLRNAPSVDLESIPVDTTLKTGNVSALANPSLPTTQVEVSQDVINALIWLGNKSLEEYKLTYPDKDNAYYYFSRLLRIDPDNENAIKGIKEIAERYVILAERAFTNKDHEKTDAYISIGLKIDPENRSLHSLRSINEENREKGLFEKIRSYFN